MFMLELNKETKNMYFEKLKEMGVKDYTLKEYAYLGHGADMEELDDVSAWLKERLPQ